MNEPVFSKNKFKIDASTSALLSKYVKFASGPIRFAEHRSKEDEMWDKVHSDMLELSKECCKICGVHLEINEINSKLRCTVCYFKVDDR